MNSLVVDEDVLHFEVGLLTSGLLFVFDEGVLERVVGALVADNFAGEDLTEAGEDHFEIFICWERLVFMKVMALD